MRVDPDGLVLVCVLCGALGFLMGWMGGVVEGAQRERARARNAGVPGTRPSKEWYAEKIADTQQAEDAAGGVLAAGALGVKACGSHQCIAAQRDGVLCADGECDRENGVRPDGVAAATPLSDEAIDKLARQHGATLEDDNGAVPAFYSIPMNRLAPFVRAACGVPEVGSDADLFLGQQCCDGFVKKGLRCKRCGAVAGDGVAVPRLPQQWEALIEEAVDAFAEGATLGDRLPNAMAALRDALASGVPPCGKGQQ